jgi:hypothetical protein
MHYLNLMFHGVEAIRPGFNTALPINLACPRTLIVHDGSIRTFRIFR